jgi:hypothetical protein
MTPLMRAASFMQIVPAAKARRGALSRRASLQAALTALRQRADLRELEQKLDLIGRCRDGVPDSWEA